MGRMYFRAGRAWPVFLLLLFAVVGCARSLYPVHGRVTYEDGTPLTGGLVVFEKSQEGQSAIMARGNIQPDGSYQLSTYRPGDGVPPGRYQVLVSPPTDLNEVDKPQRESPFDPRYMAFATSGLGFEVKEGTNEFPIRLAKKRQTQRKR